MSGVWIAVIVCLWAAVLTLAVVVAGVLRRVAAVLDSGSVAGLAAGMRPGPAVGSRLPDHRAGQESGPMVALSELPGPCVLAILTSTCSPCLTVAQWLREHPIASRVLGAASSF